MKVVKKILIVIFMIAGALVITGVGSRMSEGRKQAAAGRQDGKSGAPESVGGSAVNVANKPGRAMDAPEERNRLRSNISAVLESGQERSEKMEKARGLLAKLSEIEGCAVTVEWLKGQVGEGADFSILVSGIFVGSKEPLDVLFKEINNLPSGSKGGVSAVLFKKILESGESVGQVKTALAAGDPNSLNEGMPIALQLVLQQSKSLDESMKSMRAIIDNLDGEGLVKFRAAYLTGLSKVSPETAWKEMRMLGQGSPDSDAWQQGLKEKISAQLRVSGASESLEFLVKEGGASAEVEKSVTMWGNMNPVELKKWVSNHMNDLSPQQQDGVRSGLANLLLEKRDFQAIREQLDKISDQGVKADVERKLAQGQRDAIRQDVVKDPDGTLAAIVQNGSGYDDYCLEEAMATWIAKDPSKAEEWYQKNWKSLPAEKSQYVAAAYAGEAVKQGDIASATQWAAYIKDPKTRKRIQDKIDATAN